MTWSEFKAKVDQRLERIEADAQELPLAWIDWTDRDEVKIVIRTISGEPALAIS